MNNAHVHPLIAAALQGFDAKPIDEQIKARDAYKHDLQIHDWDHEFSDDHRVYAEGRLHLVGLRAAQKALDPHGVVWDSIAPDGHKLRLGRDAS